MCLLCFSTEKPAKEDMQGKYGEAYAQYIDYQQNYAITMCQAPCNECPCWFVSMICCPCSIVWMRHKVLNHVNPGSGWKDYKCCQGYFGRCCCFVPGECGDSACPCPCMALEACCCAGPAVSVNSIVIRDKYQLGLDDDDVRLIRCNNCLFCLSIICSCLAICFDSLRNAASCINCISDTVFCCTSSCMTAQTYHEIKLRVASGGAPAQQTIER